MPGEDPLSDLQAALEERAVARSRPGAQRHLHYQSPARASGAGARVLLHLLGWLFILFGIASLAMGIYGATRPIPFSGGDLARLYLLLTVVILVGGALYLVTGIVYVWCGITLNRTAAAIVYVLTCVWIVLFLVHIGYTCWKFSQTSDPGEMVSVGTKIAVGSGLIVTMIAMLFALSSAMARRSVRRH